MHKEAFHVFVCPSLLPHASSQVAREEGDYTGGNGNALPLRTLQNRRRSYDGSCQSHGGFESRVAEGQAENAAHATVWRARSNRFDVDDENVKCVKGSASQRIPVTNDIRGRAAQQA